MVYLVRLFLKVTLITREYKIATLGDKDYFETTPEIKLYYSLIDNLSKRRYRTSEIVANEEDFNFSYIVATIV